MWCFSSADYDAAQHGAGNVLCGLFDFDDLEPPRQCRIFLEVLLVLGPRGGCNGAQLAARESRLEQIGRIVLARLAAGADHGVGFVDEENDLFGRGFDLVDQALQAIFEFAFDACAGLQKCQIEAVDVHSLQVPAERRR